MYSLYSLYLEGKGYICLSVYSKELLKAEVVRSHSCAIFFWELAQFFTFERETGTKAFFWWFGKIWQNSLKFYISYGILGPFFCAKLSVWYFGCTKELAFRMSDTV